MVFDIEDEAFPAGSRQTSSQFKFQAGQSYVRGLSVALIDAMNPFGEAYSVLARSLNEETLRQIQENIAAKRVMMSEQEARQYAERPVTFKRERDRLPSLASNDPCAKKLAEGVAAYTEYRKRAKAAAGKVEE